MDQDTISTLTNLVANVGFPCLVAIFLLVRMETKLGALIETINRLAVTIENMTK